MKAQVSRFIKFECQNHEERVIFIVLTLTFVWYFFGALYLIAPITGWGLFAWLAIKKILLLDQTNKQSNNQKSWMSLLWLGSSLGLLVALCVGHIDFDLGLPKTIKSVIGWAKGWALLCVFIVVGANINIRFEVLVRAACIVGGAALALTPILIVAYLFTLPETLYVSPLKILGGSGPEYFTVMLYEIDPGNGAPRWRYFAPWAPAVGFVANLYFLCCLFEKDKRWKAIGVLGSMLMIVLSASRMGLIVLFVVPTVMYFFSRLTELWVITLAVLAIFLIALTHEFLFDFIETSINQIKQARVDSTRVRAALNDMAYSRWLTEAYWFGHGVVEAGSHYVEFMPIGSHHNWYGLLFVKGMAGLLSFGIPFLITGLALLLRAQFQPSARLGLGLFMVLSFFSLSENLEALAYLTWPAWLLIGIALREPFSQLNCLSTFSTTTNIDTTINYAYNH